MSLSSTRAEIVAALSAAPLAGVVKPFPKYRQTARPGDAWPRLVGRNRASNGFGFVDTWEVWVILPQKLDDAETWLEAHLDTLLAQLDRPLFFRGIESAVPAEVVLGAIATNALILTGAREG